MALAKNDKEERPILAVEERILEGLKIGLHIIAKIRGFRVAFTPVVYFYIELVAIDKHNDNQEIEIGFWPGMSNELREAQNTLNEIKERYKSVKIVHLKDPVYLN